MNTKKNVTIYAPSQVASRVELFNKHLKNDYKDLKEDEQFFEILIHKDLLENLKDPEKFFNDYIEFMQKFDMPYSFFPYYTYFNKVLQDLSSTPNPRVELEIKDVGKYHIVNQICQGCVFLNINKLKSINFTFDKDYPTIYFLQDMVQKCFEKNLWISNCWFLDRLESWKDLKVLNNDGWTMDGKLFQEQKEKYSKLNINYHPVQTFIENLKNRKVKNNETSR